MGGGRASRNVRREAPWICAVFCLPQSLAGALGNEELMLSWSTPVQPPNRAPSAAWPTAVRTKQICALLLLVGSAGILSGWLLHIDALLWALPGTGIIRANAAAALLFGSIALIALDPMPVSVLRRCAGSLAGGLVLLVGSVTLLEFVAGIDLGIDQWLVADRFAGTAALIPGRMGMNSSLCLTLLGAALVLTAAGGGRRIRIAHTLTLVASLVALSTLLGHLYGVAAFYRLFASTGMSLHTAAMVLVLAVGVLSLSPNEWMMSRFTSDGPGGQMLRRLVPLSAGAIALMGWLIIGAGPRLGLTEELSVPTFVVLTMVAMTSLAIWTAGVLERVTAVRTEMQEALALRERHYQTLAEAMPQIVFTATAAGRVDYFNQRWYDFTGSDPGESLHEAARRFVHPDDLPGTRAKWRLAVQHALPYEVEHRLRSQSNDYRWHLVRAVPLRDDTRGVMGWMGTATDVDDQKNAESALRASEERFQLAVAATRALLYDWSIAKNRVWRSAGLIDVIGIAPGESEDATEWWLSRMHPEDRADVPRLDEGPLAHETKSTREYRVRDRFDRYVWVRDYGLVVRDERGKAVRMVGSIVNIDQEKQAEVTLREEARRKDEFLATLGHELRNPLAPIVGGIQLLRRLELPSREATDACAMIERHTTHLVRLVEELLDATRVSHGKVTLRRDPLELSTIVSRAVESTRPLFASRGVALDIGTLPPVWVDGDEVRLTQVLTNLLNNGAKFTQRLVRIDVRVTGTEAAMHVIDDGIGIAPAMLPHVFEPFAQVTPALETGVESGLGLGLSLVRELVELHGGTVEARSAGAGQGSAFIVRLPTIAPPVEAPAQAAVPETSGRKQRILLVDDNVDASAALAALLQFEGHDVRVAQDGPSALEAAAIYRPTVILLDIGLPGMDGYEVARRLRASPASADALIVAITGYGHAEAVARSRAAGFDRHMIKPIDPGVLLQTFQSMAAS